MIGGPQLRKVRIITKWGESPKEELLAWYLESIADLFQRLCADASQAYVEIKASCGAYTIMLHKGGEFVFG